MTAKDYLSRTLGALGRAWSRSPATFLDHDIRDPQTIANRMVEMNLGEEDVRHFLEAVQSYKKVDPIQLTLAMRTLMENGSELAAEYRNRGLTIAMGDHHDMGEDYTLAAIQYTIAYLHGDDKSFYHMANEVEVQNRPRDQAGYENAIKFLSFMPDDPQSLALLAEELPELGEGVYPPAYYEEIVKAMRDHPELKQAIRADFLIYRAAAAVHHGLDRSRAWTMHLDGLRAGPTDHASKNPVIREVFNFDRRPSKEL